MLITGARHRAVRRLSSGSPTVAATVWCDTRVARHIFEIDGLLKYSDDPVEARAALRKEKARQDFISGFKLGVSRITANDCGPGRAAALTRLSREFEHTCRRFGTSIDDLRPFILRARAGEAPDRRTLG